VPPRIPTHCSTHAESPRLSADGRGAHFAAGAAPYLRHVTNYFPSSPPVQADLGYRTDTALGTWVPIGARARVGVAVGP
jgi:hypothetical protein